MRLALLLQHAVNLGGRNGELKSRAGTNDIGIRCANHQL